MAKLVQVDFLCAEYVKDILKYKYLRGGDNHYLDKGKVSLAYID